MYILDICDESAILINLRMIKIIINAISIIVPILVIVFSVMTFTKAVKDGSNKEAFNSFKNKLIAAIAILLIPNLVFLIINNTSGNKQTIISCFSKNRFSKSQISINFMRC